MLVSETISRRSAEASRTGGPSGPAAEHALRLRIAQSPGDADALAELAQVAKGRGEFDEAGALLGRAVGAAPHLHDLKLMLARLHLDQFRPHEALETIATITGPARDSFPVATFEAAVLGILGRHEPEIELYERLLPTNPRHAALWTSYGNALKYAGRADDALRALRKSVTLEPGYGEGWWAIANLKSARFTSRDIAAMRRALSQGAAPADALHLHFALGRAFEGRQAYAESFEHYAAANRLMASALAPQAMYATAAVDDLIATFDPAVASRFGEAGHPSAEPIFVVGLQRSGSTLVEQILASHPEIEGTSELMVMQQLWAETAQAAATSGMAMRDYLLAMPPSERSALGARYLERSRPFRLLGKAKFVDKLPANWMQTGFIRLILPNARIVDARRHPMACGFSNFQQHYATGVHFAYSLDSIGTFYRDYLRLMRHFAAIDPAGTHLVVNERLIEQTEREVRELLDFVGVPFAPECLAFHRTRRAVNTPSAEQVRRPINRDGMDHWKHYAAWLGPLEEALGPALADWDSNRTP